MDRFRYRLVFQKLSHIRFIGHLDLQRAMERTMRRARLPLAYSKGFHPRPRFQFASPLPLGLTGRAELVDTWLERPLSPPMILAQLGQAAPPGLTFSEVKHVPGTSDSLPKLVEAATYEVSLDASQYEGVPAKVDILRQMPTILRQRRGRDYDLRPLIERLAIEHEPPMRLTMQLAMREGAAGRPEEVLDALGLPVDEFTICRTALVLGNT